MKCLALFVVTGFIFTLCSGCASVHVPLKQEDAQRITTMQMQAVVVQEEIAAEVEKSKVSTYTGGGLIPALIDLAVESHRAQSANQLLEPVRKSCTGFDFRKELAGQLQGLKEGGALKLSEAVVNATPLDEEARLALFGRMNGNALLELNVSYRLSADFNSVSVLNSAKLWMKGQADPVYANQFTYRSPSLQKKEKDEAAAAWAENDGVLLRKTLQNASAEIAHMLASDFTNPPQAAAK